MLDRTQYPPAAAVSTEPAIPPAVCDLVNAFQRASPAERVRAARLIGVDAVWDGMIVPAIS